MSTAPTTPPTRRPPDLVDRQAVLVRLTLLIGACHQPRITKRQIEESLERCIREIEGLK